MTDHLTDAERRELARLTDELERRQSAKFRMYFPDTGPLRRELYPKHIAFMAAGATHRERLFLKANRVGGTETASFELTAHLTGDYPSWWTGRRFSGPIHAWCAGDTMLTTRDILQLSLLGSLDDLDTQQWSGMIPAHMIHHVTRKGGGVPRCVDQVWVHHRSGDGTSVLEFKSYDQGQRAFQGTAQHVVWLDEEPPNDVYTECLLRTMTTTGMILATFTPLQGLTPFIQQYLETAVMADTEGREQCAADVFWPDRMNT